MKKPAASDTRVEEMPVYWFSMLDQAAQQGDLDLAAKAQRELERLGVHVEYRLSKAVRPQDTEVPSQSQK